MKWFIVMVQFTSSNAWDVEHLSAESAQDAVDKVRKMYDFSGVTIEIVGVLSTTAKPFVEWDYS